MPPRRLTSELQQLRIHPYSGSSFAQEDAVGTPGIGSPCFSSLPPVRPWDVPQSADQLSANLENQVRPIQQDREPVEHVPAEQGIRFVVAREHLDRDRIQLPDL